MLPIHYPVYKAQFEFLNGFEWVIILLIILLIFGPSKLPQLARGLGQAIYEFRRASQGIVEEKPKEEKKETKELDEETLKALAKKLGIDNTENMEKEQLARLVVEKAKEKGLIKEA